MATDQARYLKLEGSYNIRDIGGYPTSDGRQTRWHSFIRADRLTALTTDSQQALLDYGVRTVIDMRFPREIAKTPNVFAQSTAVTYLNLAVFTDEAASQVEFVETLFEQNLFTLDECQAQMRTVFEAIATQPLGVLVHCTIGKDRTGLIVALLLSLVGVPLEIIAQDYALSAVYLEPVLEKMRQRARASRPEIAYKLELKLTALPETILDTLNYVEQKYGGALGYLQTIGVTSAQIIALGALLVE